MVTSGIVNAETWNLALKTLAMLEKFEREERQERQRRENSELARLKHEFAIKKENSIDVDEYKETLRMVQEALEKYVPYEKMGDFTRDFRQIIDSVRKK